MPETTELTQEASATGIAGLTYGLQCLRENADIEVLG
jgi:hypothetical protein